MNQEALRGLDKEALIDLILAQAEAIKALTARVAELEARLGEPPKTPGNSGLPPSNVNGAGNFPTYGAGKFPSWRVRRSAVGVICASIFRWPSATFEGRRVDFHRDLGLTQI